jgi:hypothetical protein
MRPLLWIAVIAVILGCLPSIARAQEDPKRAKEAFKEGTRQFNLGQFDKAIEAWQRGYQFKPHPDFLFNIGQAYRLSGNATKAVFFYKLYLADSPNAANHDEVQKYVNTLQKVIDAERQNHGSQRPNGPGPGPKSPNGPMIPAAGNDDPSNGDPGEPPVPHHPDSPGIVYSAERADAHKVDILVGTGVGMWASGTANGTHPTPTLLLGADYHLRALSAGRMATTIGGRFILGVVSDRSSTDTAVSFLATPTLHLRMSPRWSGFAEFGLGLIVLGGLNKNSLFVRSSQVMEITGALPSFEFRPRVGATFWWKPNLGFFAAPSLSYSPSPSNYFVDSSLARFEIDAGVAFGL